MEPLLSPRQLAQALGVSESSVKRWVDGGRLAAIRTRGGHRRIAREEAIRFARTLASGVREPSLLRLGPWNPILEPAESAQGRIEQLLLAGDREAVIGAILRGYAEGASVAGLVDRLIAPPMRRIGELWCEQSDGVFVEHRATEICSEALHRLQSLIAVGNAEFVAIGGSIGGDSHSLPSLCAAVSLRAEGLAAVNLGGDLPLQSFLDAIAAHRPALIWLSLSSDLALEGAEELIEELGAAARGAAASLIVGGRAAEKLRPGSAGLVARGSSMGELVAFARGKLAHQRP